MVVDAEVWYWQPTGMSKSVAFACGASRERYITVRDAERLLEEAHKRGFRDGYDNGYDTGTYAAKARRTDDAPY